MKKHIFLLTLLVLSVFSIQVNAQQGKWAGTIKYQLTWTGDIPAEAQLPTEWETKVFENKTKSMSFMWAMSGSFRFLLTFSFRQDGQRAVLLRQQYPLL